MADDALPRIAASSRVDGYRATGSENGSMDTRCVVGFNGA